MKYVHSKDLAKMLPGLISRGGQYQRAAERVAAILGHIKLGHHEPLANLPMTNHGETRIKHCIKYDLSGYCRLITIQCNDCCFFMFVGDHDQCTTWLERNRGLKVGLNKDSKEFEVVFKSDDIEVPERRVLDEPDYIQGSLLKRLGTYYFDKISQGISYKVIKEIEGFDENTDEETILDLAMSIQNKDLGEVVFDAFVLARKGNIDGAKTRILQYEDHLKLLDTLSEPEINNAVSNNYFKDTQSLTDQDIQLLMNGKSWLDWMLFMHPDQSSVVAANFGGAARLLGVSGSGKTAIIVRRAIALGIKYPNERILVLTLNRSLSKLINKLVDAYTDSLDQGHTLRARIKVSSYWELCKDLLLNLVEEINEQKSLSDFTDKHDESIEECWEEFYTCQSNNEDARVLLPIHRSLLQRSIRPHNYIKQEFDWVRSALSIADRPKYADLEREGRAIAFSAENRQQIIEGLSSWENFMNHVGITDYLGLTQKLYQYRDRIQPAFRSILVDEIQDFGTLELSIIRQLVPEGENDLFLSGDIAQQVYTKHHKITQAGIRIQPSNYLTILKNYRNSREILSAAYQLFKSNTNIASFELDDFKVLEPEFANFSSPKPFIRGSSSLRNEFNFACTYLKDLLDEDKKGCIALAGYSYYDVQKIGKMVGLPSLDGNIDLTGHSIFLSDLEQTKGFEFDRIVIINCSDQAIPNPEFPKEEWFRDISKLYVAMTRAKVELVISYSGSPSRLFESCNEYFTTDKWTDHVKLESTPHFDLPDPSSQFAPIEKLNITGLDFLYSRKALGFTLELQDKLIELVGGKMLSDEKGNKLKWKSMDELIVDIKSGRSTPNLAQRFGRTVLRELQEKLDLQIKVIVR